jgi:hypothetical protein
MPEEGLKGGYIQKSRDGGREKEGSGQVFMSFYVKQ